MKNLEIKLRLRPESKTDVLEPFYVETLYQTDTYFSCPNGRLKLREETGKTSYFIFYQRENINNEKISNYECYPVSDLVNFWKLFASLFHEELKVVKERRLFLIENARVHLDTVTDLGQFMEIEVVIKTEEEDRKASDLLLRILKMTGVENNERIASGYREMLIRKLDDEKTLSYFTKEPKMFWVVNKDIPGVPEIRANNILPCLFTEKRNGNHYVLQLDLSIKDNGKRYTMWRKLVGQTYNIQCDVLLIVDNKLYDLQGNVITSVGRSDIYVHRSFLAYFA